MNINSNNNSSIGMNISFYQDHQTIEQELERAQEQNEKKKKKKKFHGNRKLQRYRGELRQRGMNTSVNTESSVDIWHGHVSKPSAEKYSICHTYGRSKAVIEERTRVIEKQLKQAQNVIAQFEQNHDCLSVLKELNTIICQIVQEKQRVMKDKLE
ncbi:unnamed protein product [Adineta ricciae]|uniref:Uncharacterized protein n=1 Tax=Adineta ricciae TaxID=249248 RepID=A0A816GW33_ADIRI|nr:unnamed protein product [Adineta ricciae]